MYCYLVYLKKKNSENKLCIRQNNIIKIWNPKGTIYSNILQQYISETESFENFISEYESIKFYNCYSPINNVYDVNLTFTCIDILDQNTIITIDKVNLMNDLKQNWIRSKFQKKINRKCYLYSILKNRLDTNLIFYLFKYIN